jgi:hypothetical protein
MRAARMKKLHACAWLPASGVLHERRDLQFADRQGLDLRRAALPTGHKPLTRRSRHEREALLPAREGARTEKIKLSLSAH